MQTHDGGKPNVKQAHYAHPQGPTDMHRQKPGLGGDNYGPCGTQGEYSIRPSTSGSPGIGGSRHPHGTQK